jgi:hypothetical protein
MRKLIILIAILITSVMNAQRANKSFKININDTIYGYNSKTILKELKMRKEFDVVVIKAKGELTLLENPFNKNRTVYYLANTNKLNKLRVVNDKRQDGVYVAGYNRIKRR